MPFQRRKQEASQHPGPRLSMQGAVSRAEHRLHMEGTDSRAHLLCRLSLLRGPAYSSEGQGSLTLFRKASPLGDSWGHFKPGALEGSVHPQRRGALVGRQRLSQNPCKPNPSSGSPPPGSLLFHGEGTLPWLPYRSASPKGTGLAT